MIIVKLKGGLGNMMFQYALGRNLSLKNNAELKFIVSRPIEPDVHVPIKDYQSVLEEFNVDISGNIAPEREVRRLSFYRKRYGRLGKILNIFTANNLNYIKESKRGFQPEILKLKDGFILEGFWQNEKYFIESRDVILKDFELKQPMNQRNSELAEKIQKSNAVSIHVRRGDYVLNPKNNKKHGVLGNEYYKKALDILSSKTKNIKLFIFSDDIEWVKENIKTPFETTYVSGNIQKPHLDMFLMSLCKHHIIANSSFSWWGAWLSNYSDKIVVAPEKWLVNPSSNDSNDRVPSSWIKIS